MNCITCHQPEFVCGPLSSVGECLDCEFSASNARELEVLAILQERGYEGAAVQPPEKPAGGCSECGGVEWLEDAGLKMCTNCGSVQ